MVLRFDRCTLIHVEIDFQTERRVRLVTPTAASLGLARVVRATVLKVRGAVTVRVECRIIGRCAISLLNEIIYIVILRIRFVTAA